MQQKINLLALFFIIGIVIGMGIPLPHTLLPPFAGVAVSLLTVSFMLSRNGQRFIPVFIIGSFLAGWVVFSWRIDTTSPYHIVHFADDKPFIDKTEVGGWIVKEPEVRQFKTIVVLKPEYVRTGEDGPRIPVTGGLIQLELRPSMRRTYSLYQYGDYVTVRYTSLTRPDPANNPGVFDYRRFLENNDIYGTMRIAKDYNMQRITERGNDNFFVDFALNLKKKLLFTIKKTMPYPESAFLGGVMLGLRQGLSRTVQDEFRAAGVAHVLAVSGLHVTIITALLFGLLSMFKVPRKFLAPPIIIGLIIFAIITGGRPSTLRAVIMNSVSLLSYCYLASNLKNSLLFGISIAAVAILFFTPMILFEASFLYSFMAVLSLALLTGPLLKFLNRTLTSVHAIILFVLSLVVLGTLLVDVRMLFQSPPKAVLILGSGAILAWILRDFIPRTVKFSRLPFWFTSFTGAQMAIQLGLGPLNAFYFQKYSLAAPLANFLAIPLIGVNVQLGIIAGILGFIPIIGDYLALVVNAANFLTVKLFLGSASFFAHAIPYPDVTPPPMWFMFLYFIVLVFIAYSEPITDWLRVERIRLRVPFSKPEIRKRALVTATVFGLFLVSASSGFMSQTENTLKITVLDLSVFGMGGGSAQLVEFPGGKTMMIDGGVAVVKKRGNALPWNMGSMVVCPVLRSKRIRTIDWVVLSSPDAECTGGLPPLMESFFIRNFIDSLPLTAEERSDLDLDTFLRVVGDEYYEEKADSPLVQETFAQYVQVLSTVQAKDIPVIQAKRDQVLLDTTVDGKPMTMTVLHPPDERIKGFRTTTNNSLVMKVRFGDFTCLFPALITIDGEKDLLALGDQLKADVLIAPFHGYKGSLYSDFVKLVKPKLVVIQTTEDRWKERDIAKNVQLYTELGCQVLRTDKRGAITVSSDGSDAFSVHSMIPETAALGSEK